MERAVIVVLEVGAAAVVVALPGFAAYGRLPAPWKRHGQEEEETGKVPANNNGQRINTPVCPHTGINPAHCAEFDPCSGSMFLIASQYALRLFAQLHSSSGLNEMIMIQSSKSTNTKAVEITTKWLCSYMFRPCQWRCHYYRILYVQQMQTQDHSFQMGDMCLYAFGHRSRPVGEGGASEAPNTPHASVVCAVDILPHTAGRRARGQSEGAERRVLGTYST